MKNCDNFYCHWVQHSQDPDYYYCLKCERERRLNSSDDGWIWILLFLIALIVAIAMG
jgi:hypothetical protein